MTTALPLPHRRHQAAAAWPPAPWAAIPRAVARRPWWRLLRAARSPVGRAGGRPVPAEGRAESADGHAGSSAAASPPRSAAALDELYHARRLGLIRLAVLMVDDLPTAEDIVQDVFTAMYRRHGGDLRGVADPHSYLTTSVMNAARSTLRRRRSARAYLPPRVGTSPAAEEQVLLRDGDREVMDALHELTIRQRQVVVLRYWSELSESEIAETLRMSRGTVKSTASRALAVLRRLLEQKR